MGELLGDAVAIRPRPIERCEEASLGRALSDPLVAAVLRGPEVTGLARCVVEIAPDLAGRLVDRLLGGSGDTPLPPVATEPMGDIERGALAYLCSEILDDATSPAEWQVGAILTSDVACAAALGAGPFWVWPATLEVGRHAGVARVWVPEPWLEALGGGRARAPQVLLAALVEMSLTHGQATVTTSELRSLRPGDVVLLDDTSRAIRLARADEIYWPVDRAERGEIVTAKPARREGPMTQNDMLDDVLRTVGDAPVRVTVELARFELRLDEVAALRPGEVLETGANVGDHVTLRVGGQAFAKGELVDVEGELGVRILELAR
jgi:type III secretion system YscQ/HrcQ family protein